MKLNKVSSELAMIPTRSISNLSDHKAAPNEKDIEQEQFQEEEVFVIDPSKLTQARSNVAPRHNSPFLNQDYVNLVSQGNVIFATDEWFARAENLLNDSDPEFVPDLYCDQGKVMDGWESRRRREAGHDWCVIALNKRDGLLAEVFGVEVDTAFFTGNQAPRISIEVANLFDSSVDADEYKFTWMPGAAGRMARGGGVQGTGEHPDRVKRAQAACDQFNWTEILPMTPLLPGYEETRMHYFTVPDDLCDQTRGFTHVKVNYFPDGGVARLRLWGKYHDKLATISKSIDEITLPSQRENGDIELSCERFGGMGLECSNKHYGVPQNLIRSSYGVDMGDGWETARNPKRPPIVIKDPATGLVDSPLMDWAVLKLGCGGTDNNGVTRIILDTKHFKGNFPESVMIEACCASSNVTDEMVCSVLPGDKEGVISWFPLLKRTKMGPDREHEFLPSSLDSVNFDRHITHVRVHIYPDGGLSRVRVYGKPANDLSMFKMNE
jgi:allantoicase